MFKKGSTNFGKQPLEREVLLSSNYLGKLRKETTSCKKTNE
jgi:hypothetical protein